MELLVVNNFQRQRVEFINECKRAVTQERKERGRTHAQKQIKICTEMGLPESLAVQVMRIAHPTFMVESAEWTRQAVQALLETTQAHYSDIRDTLNFLLLGYQGAKGPDQKRFPTTLELLGLPPVTHDANSRAFSCVLLGAHEIIKHLSDLSALLANREAVA